MCVSLQLKKIASYLSGNDLIFSACASGVTMPNDKFIEELMESPEKRVKLYKWILTAQLISVALIVVGGLVFILWTIGVI